MKASSRANPCSAVVLEKTKTLEFERRTGTMVGYVAKLNEFALFQAVIVSAA
jgi:hypothetical protein